MKPTRVIRGADPCGRPIVRVQLARLPGIFATVDADDYDSWVAAGLSTNWYLNASGSGSSSRLMFSLTTAAGSMAGVARYLLRAGAGERVRYLDGDRLNLRRSNLGLTQGYAKAAAIIHDEFASPDARVTTHSKSAPLAVAP